MEIKKLQETDIRTLAALYVSVFSQAPWHEEWRMGWAIDRIEVLHRTPGAYGLCMHHNDSILGAVIGRAMPFKGAMEFEIIEFFVAPERQQQGIGQQLLAALQTHLRERAYSKCTLLTGRHTPAKQFYAEQGFDTHDNLIFMSCQLNQSAPSA